MRSILRDEKMMPIPRAWAQATSRFSAFHVEKAAWFPVYDVKEDDKGIRFLTYMDGGWKYRDSSEFAG